MPHAAPLPEGYEILKSFDARDWAKAFVAHVNANPSIPTDEATMVGWFASALMCGYDECKRRTSTSGNEESDATIIRNLIAVDVYLQ